jgi:hypothetical protein
MTDQAADAAQFAAAVLDADILTPTAAEAGIQPERRDE